MSTLVPLVSASIEWNTHCYNSPCIILNLNSEDAAVLRNMPVHLLPIPSCEDNKMAVAVHNGLVKYRVYSVEPVLGLALERTGSVPLETVNGKVRVHGWGASRATVLNYVLAAAFPSSNPDDFAVDVWTKNNVPAVTVRFLSERVAPYLLEHHSVHLLLVARNLEPDQGIDFSTTDHPYEVLPSLSATELVLPDGTPEKQERLRAQYELVRVLSPSEPGVQSE